MATPKTVTGTARSVNRRCRRQKPTRLPNSYIDSMGSARSPMRGSTKPNSVSSVSEPASPWSTLFSAPSS